MIIILIFVFAVIVKFASEANCYAEAKDHLRKQKEFNLKLHEVTQATIDEQCRRKYKDDPKKLRDLTGGRVTDPNTPVKIPEIDYDRIWGKH